MKPPIVTGRANVGLDRGLSHGQARRLAGGRTAGSRSPQTHHLVIKMTFARSNDDEAALVAC